MEGPKTKEMGRLAYVEQQLAQIVDEAAPRVPDPDISARLHEAAERHRRHARDLLRLRDVRLPDKADSELAHHVESMRRQVRHARGLDGLMAALAEVETDEDQRYVHALAAHPGPDAEQLLKAEEEDIQEDLRVYLEQSSGLAPDIEDARRKT